MPRGNGRGNKGDKGKPVKGLPAARDPNSGAVVFNDNAGYQRRVKAKRQGKKIAAQSMQIQRQEERINKLEKAIEQLLSQNP